MLQKRPVAFDAEDPLDRARWRAYVLGELEELEQFIISRGRHHPDYVDDMVKVATLMNRLL